jgi:hypothetical protein
VALYQFVPPGNPIPRGCTLGENFLRGEETEVSLIVEEFPAAAALLPTAAAAAAALLPLCTEHAAAAGM